jgi:hypothetical protein
MLLILTRKKVYISQKRGPCICEGYTYHHGYRVVLTNNNGKSFQLSFARFISEFEVPKDRVIEKEGDNRVRIY